MNELTRWNKPGLTKSRSLFSEFEQMMDDMMRLTGRQFTDRPAAWGLAVDVAENDDEFTVQASLPGVDPSDIDITLEDNILSIAGEVKEEEEIEGKAYHIRERRYGQFRRSISLPTRVEVEAIEADYADGVLTVHVPKAEDVKPKKISIKSAAKTIEASTS